MPNCPAPPARMTLESSLRRSLGVSAVADALQHATGEPRERCERWAAFVLRAMQADELRLFAYCGLEAVAEANNERFDYLSHEQRLGRAQSFELALRTATLAAAELLPETSAAMRTLMQADAERERFRPRSRELTNRSVSGRGRRELLDLDGNTVA